MDAEDGYVRTHTVFFPRYVKNPRRALRGRGYMDTCYERRYKDTSRPYSQPDSRRGGGAAPIVRCQGVDGKRRRRRCDVRQSDNKTGRKRTYKGSGRRLRYGTSGCQKQLFKARHFQDIVCRRPVPPAHQGFPRRGSGFDSRSGASGDDYAQKRGRIGLDRGGRRFPLCRYSPVRGPEGDVRFGQEPVFQYTCAQEFSQVGLSGNESYNG